MPELMPNNSELQKRRNTILFINATQEVIEEEGLENISIRKIAQKAGFHNSTIYLYFKDLDQLTMLASMKYFQEYSQMLEVQSQKEATPAENFMAIWDFFCDAIMKKPHIFYNFFFGKRSNDLRETINMYYDIFPAELKSFSADIEIMYFGKNIIERSLKLLPPLIPEDNHITEDNLDMLNEIIVSYCKYKLEEKCQNENLDSKKLKDDFLNAISYITGIKRR